MGVCFVHYSSEIRNPYIGNRHAIMHAVSQYIEILYLPEEKWQQLC